MDELEEIKKKKLQELMQEQQEAQQQVNEEIQLQQQIGQLEVIVKRKLTKDAAERYSNLKIAHPEKAVQILVLLAQAIQADKINQVNDEQLKELLKKLTQKKEFKIRRK